MKKVLTFVLILLTAFSLVACGGSAEPTAKEVYNTYLQKAGTIDAMDVDVDMQMKMMMGTETMEAQALINMKVANTQSVEDALMQATMTIKQSGMSIEMGMYYADGWGYVDVLGMKVKQQTPMEKFATQFDGMQIEEMVEPDWLESAVVTKNQDGSYTMEIKMEGEAFLDYYEMLMSGIEDVDVAGVTFNDATLTLVFDKEYYPVSAEAKTGAAMEVEGSVVDIEIGISMKYNAFGDDVVITPPALDEYVEANL